MSPPSEQELQVATGSLRVESATWLRQGDRLEAIAAKAEGLRVGRLESGIFQLVVSAYDAAVDQVAVRCREGHRRMTDIATTLREVADIYEDEENRDVHRFTGRY